MAMNEVASVDPDELAKALDDIGLRLRGYPAVCACVEESMQRCHVCDPDGEACGLIRPELALRIDG